MKNLILFITLACFGQIAKAQQVKLTLKELQLRGKVKEVVEHEYMGDFNQLNIDTSKQTGKSIMKFNSIGNELEEMNLDKFGKLIHRSIYTYKKDKTILINGYNTNNELDYQSRYVFKFDNKGNEIEFDEYNAPDLNSLSKYIYKYGKNGNIIEEYTYFPRIDTPIRAILFYNKKNQIVERDSYNGDSKNFDKDVFTYDPDGNQIKEENYDINGKLTVINSTSYDKLDQHKNWLVKVSETKIIDKRKGDRSLKIISKRTISYYQL